MIQWRLTSVMHMDSNGIARILQLVSMKWQEVSTQGPLSTASRHRPSTNTHQDI